MLSGIYLFYMASGSLEGGTDCRVVGSMINLSFNNYCFNGVENIVRNLPKNHCKVFEIVYQPAYTSELDERIDLSTAEEALAEQ